MGYQIIVVNELYSLTLYVDINGMISLSNILQVKLQASAGVSAQSLPSSSWEDMPGSGGTHADEEDNFTRFNLKLEQDMIY